VEDSALIINRFHEAECPNKKW